MTNASQSLMLREFGLLSRSEFSEKHIYDSLRWITNDQKARFKVSSSPIIEIIPSANLLFIINSNHRCLCVSKFSHQVLFELTAENEDSKTVYCNRFQNAVILIVLISDQEGNRLKCRSYSLNDLENGIVEPVELFKDENLSNPGFIEFDDANQLILTRSMNSQYFKLWKLDSYRLCYEIKEVNVEEIRLTNELLMLIHSPRETSIICKLCSVESGKMLDIFDIEIKPLRPIELLELFSNYLLIKQSAEPLVILNLLTMERKEVRGFISPQHFIYLYDLHLFLALRACVIEAWNFDGKLMKIFGMPVFCQSRNLSPNRLFVSRGQDLILVSCNDARYNLRNNPGNFEANSIKVFRLGTGEGVLELKDKDLDDLMTVTFDDDFGNLYTGHRSGELVRWGN